MHHLLGLVGSPRKGGNTEQLMERLLAAAQHEGAETKLFTVAGRNIAPCAACGSCVRKRDGRCVQQDDMTALYPLLLWSEAIVFGTPVYLNTMTAQLKAVFDRCRPLWWMDNALSGKLVAVITIGAGRWGGQEIAAEHVFACAFNSGMALPPSRPVSSATWRVCGVARDPGDIFQDTRAVNAAEDMGRRLAQIKICFD